jgi:capsular polysaccharide biosynthesis protein
MMNLLIGFVLGVVVSTIGFTGVAQYADMGVEKIKEVTTEVTNK